MILELMQNNFKFFLHIKFIKYFKIFQDLQIVQFFLNCLVFSFLEYFMHYVHI